MRGARGSCSASVLALALFYLLYASYPVDGLLKCYCDICMDTNHTCETDGYCFASTSLENDVITYARRCYNKTYFFPGPEYSVWCTTNIIQNVPDGIKSVVACCDHSDFCNRELWPSFPLHELEPRQRSRNDNDLEGGTTRIAVRAFLFKDDVAS